MYYQHINNDDYLYVGNTNARLLLINGRANLVDNNTLYGVTDDGTRYRLSVTTSGSSIDLYHLQEYVYVQSAYGGSWQWQDTNLYITEVPSSLNADDTYNFDCFSPSLLLTFLLSVIIIFNVFKRR